MGYREPLRHIDGTLIFQTAEDRRAQQAVADALAPVWRCQIEHFPELNPIDWYAARFKRMTGLLELKVRHNPTTRYPTVFLSVAKWFALTHGAMGFNIPSAFVVQFTDDLRWIPIDEVDPTLHTIAGTAGLRADGRSDHEPVIEVPVKDMQSIR